MMTRLICVFAVIVQLRMMAVGGEVEIVSFTGNGVVEWTAPSGSVCTIEWASRLVPTQQWARNWNPVSGILMTSAQSSASVPMFYRVVCNTNHLSMTTPYVNESEMRWLRQGYSSTTNCPWGFEHDGVDFQPWSNRAAFRAVCDGTISELCLRRDPDWGEGGMWGVYLILRVDDTWDITYNFEPKTTNMADGITQFTNMTVGLLQPVSQGDVLGYLYQGDGSAHVHVSVVKNGYANHGGDIVCPKPFFRPDARQSILRLTTNRFPTATDFCY
jgi:hypothetical protein